MEMNVLAEGEFPTGERWKITVRGGRQDFHSFLDTLYPDGRRHAGGMGGPLLGEGRLLNTATGGADWGKREILVRADLQVALVRLTFADGRAVDLAPLARSTEPPAVFFAAVLDPAEELGSVAALDAHGTVVGSEGLAHHERLYRRFLSRRAGGDGNPGGSGRRPAGPGPDGAS